jgi:DNA-binding CsgD family transcriptional regulator
MADRIRTAAVAAAQRLAVDVVHRPDRWPDLCDAVTDALGARAFMVFEFDVGQFAAPVFCGSRGIADAVPLINATMRGDLPQVERDGYARFTTFPAGQLVGEYECHDVAHDRDMPPNPYRDAVLAVTGAASRNVMRLNDIGPWIDVAALHLRCPAAELPSAERDEAEALLSVVGRSIEAARVLRGLHRLSGALIDAFDRLEFGAAVCEGSGRIVVANAAFRAMAADRDGLTDLGGVAGATLMADRARLATALAAAPDPSAPPARGLCRLSRRSGRLPLIARAVPLRRHDIGRGAESADPLTLLLVVHPEDGALVDASGIAALDCLTPAELDVCALVVAGHPTPGIAAARGTTVATATDQVKSALVKLSCATRTDILRLAMATRPPGADRGPPPRGG